MKMKGIYALVISVGEEKRLRIGSLGPLTFKRGLYIYVGSAQNNLEKRIVRHLNKNKRAFWHIDYLLRDKNVKIICVFFKEALREEECRLALALSNLYRPVKGFGSSDCKCPSHLFKIDDYKDAEMFLRGIGLKSFDVKSEFRCFDIQREVKLRVKVKVMGVLKKALGRDEILLSINGLEEARLKDVIEKILEGATPLRDALLDPELKGLSTNTIILVNGKEIGLLGGINTLIRDGDEVVLIPVVHGG